MELGDTNNPQKPYPPGPAEPFRFLFLCETEDEGYEKDLKQMIRGQWGRWISGTEFIEDPERWNECKGMVFYCENYVPKKLVQVMLNFFSRDRGESLLYQFDPVANNFVGRDEPWLRLRI